MFIHCNSKYTGYKSLTKRADKVTKTKLLENDVAALASTLVLASEPFKSKILVKLI